MGICTCGRFVTLPGRRGVRELFLSTLIRHFPKINRLARTKRNCLRFPRSCFFLLFVRLSFFRDRDLDLGFELGFDLDDEELEEDIGEE